MKILKYLSILILIFSCKEENANNKNVILKVINSSVISNKTGLDREGDTYKNLITYKLSNNSAEKLFFILNQENINFAMPISIQEMEKSLFYGKQSNLLYEISTDKDVKPKMPILNADNFSTESADCLYDVQKLNEMRSKIEALELNVFSKDLKFINEIRENSFTLYPNQTKYFTSIIYLPKQIDRINNISSEISFDFNLVYQFRLIHLSNEKTIQNSLPDYIAKELKENKIKIFDGVLISNKVPLEFVE